MKIHLLKNTLSESGYRETPTFASIAAIGTWIAQPCPGNSRKKHYIFGEPLIAEWDKSLLRLGDFVWSGGYDFITTTTSANFLTAIDPNIELKSVSHKFTAIKAKKYDALRDEIIAADFVWPVAEPVAIDVVKNHMPVIEECPDCSQKQYLFKRDGLILDKADVGDRKIFTIAELGGVTFLTDEALHRLMDLNLTNWAAAVAGDIE